MESRRFEPDPIAARRGVWKISAIFVASGIVVLLKQNTVAYVMGGIFCGIGVVFVALSLFLRPSPDRFATLLVDQDGFTLHKQPDTTRRIAWTEVTAAWPYQQHLVVKLEAGGQVLVPLIAQPPPARKEITAMFRTSLGDRFTSFLKQKV